jgi:hypothetical protein
MEKRGRKRRDEPRASLRAEKEGERGKVSSDRRKEGSCSDGRRTHATALHHKQKSKGEGSREEKGGKGENPSVLKRMERQRGGRRTVVSTWSATQSSMALMSSSSYTMSSLIAFLVACCSSGRDQVPLRSRDGASATTGRNGREKGRED